VACLAVILQFSSVERHSSSDSLHSLGTASRLYVNSAWNVGSIPAYFLLTAVRFYNV